MVIYFFSLSSGLCPGKAVEKKTGVEVYVQHASTGHSKKKFTRLEMYKFILLLSLEEGGGDGSVFALSMYS